MEDFYQRFKDLGFTIGAVNIDNRRELGEKMLEQLKVSFPVVFDTNNKVSQSYALEAMPSTFFIDREGNIRFAHKGYRKGDEAKYEEFIRSLLKE
jgi:peroxiredoxin